jgi:hypothetical protein
VPVPLELTRARAHGAVLAAIVLLLLAYPSGVATAQSTATTRAEEYAARRRAAAAEVQPSKSRRIEEAFLFIEDSQIATRLFDPPAGWFVAVGGMAEGNGFTGGGGYRFTPGTGSLDMGAVGSFRQSYRLAAVWRQPLTRSARTHAVASAARQREAQLRYSGGTPRPDFDNRIGYAVDSTSADTGVEHRFGPTVALRATAGVLVPSLGRSSDTRLPALAERFSEALAPGQVYQPTFGVYRAHLLVDRRDAPNAREGSLVDVSLARLVDTGAGTYTYTSSRADVQHFVPFWNHTRVLALRVMAEHNQADADGRVPFYLQPTIGGSRTLRGYQRQRFRDASMVLLQGEYRYEVNPFLMAAVFADAGQVAPSLARIRWRDMSTDYGVGLRFGYTTGVALRTDVAFGGEDKARLVVTFSGVF